MSVRVVAAATEAAVAGAGPGKCRAYGTLELVPAASAEGRLKTELTMSAVCRTDAHLQIIESRRPNPQEVTTP